MIQLVKRILSFATGALALGCAWWQWQEPFFYPWLALALLFWFLGASLIISRPRLSFTESMRMTATTALAMLAISLGWLMMETFWSRILGSILFAGTAFLYLELLYQRLYQPLHYPVHALEHLHLSLVPLATFFLAASLNGMVTFLHIPRWVSLASSVLLESLFFYVTSHPRSTVCEKQRALNMGALVGLHVGILIVLLPVSMAVQGAFAALLVAFVLRMRRYSYDPKPTHRVAWTEGTCGLVAFAFLLLMSRWA